MSDSGMREETARVVDIKAGLLLAEAKGRSACSHCTGGAVCASSVTAKLFGARRVRLVLANHLDARPGDQVVIGIPDELLVRASLLVYLSPLLLMLAAAALVEAWAVNEMLLSVSALAGLTLGVLGVRWTIRRGAEQRYRPRLLRVVAQARRQIEIPILTRS